MSTPDAADVVAAFNVFGYGATFAAVAHQLQVEPADLYQLYASRDDLAVKWLVNVIPKAPAEPTVRELFANGMFAIVEALDAQRDFAHAWLAALPATGVWHLPELTDLHQTLRSYFVSGLTALRADIALPSPLIVEDVVADLADVMCAVAAALVQTWRLHRYQTETAVESAACLLDALLMRRVDLGDTSLFVHLHRLALLPHERFAQPLVKLLLDRDRVARLGHASALAGLLQDLLPPHQPEQP